MEEGKKLGIEFKLVYVEELDFGVVDNQWHVRYNGKKTMLPLFAVSRVIYPMLSRQLEYMGVKVFNNSKVADICNDKARTYQVVAKTGITIVDSLFCKYEHLREKLSRCTGQTIVKTVNGHGGQQVFLLDSQNVNEVEEVVQNVDHQDVVIQPLVGSKHQDLRVYVIGRYIIAAVLREAKEGFKSNFSLGGKVSLYELSTKQREIVQEIMDQFQFGMVGIDFIVGDHDELIFNEIEDVVGARMLYQCTDINLVKLYLEHILDSL
jgi:RimK family alpha-L-glutamate ligase